MNCKAIRQCHKETCFFDLSSQQWELMQVSGSYHQDCDFLVPEARRNHVACVLNHHMIVYGGVNDFSKFLNDVAVLDLKNYKWHQYYKPTIGEF